MASKTDPPPLRLRRQGEDDAATSQEILQDTSQEILQGIATCLEQSGAHVTVKAETSSLEAYWGSDPADLDRVVGVSTSSYVEKDGGRVYYPATLTRDLPPEDAEALDDCVAKWEI